MSFAVLIVPSSLMGATLPLIVKSSSMRGGLRRTPQRALSGFISLALEVVWFRATTLFVQPTVYGYAMMLAAVRGGIALGSYAVAPLLRRRPFDELSVAPSNAEGRAAARDRQWLLTLAWLEAGIAVAALLSFAVLRFIP